MTFKLPLNKDRMKRYVKCMICRYVIETDQPNPKCPKCGCSLITILQSLIRKGEFE